METEVVKLTHAPSQVGFTLLEMLVALALIAFIALAVGDVIQMARNHDLNISSNIALDNLQLMIRNNLSNENAIQKAAFATDAAGKYLNQALLQCMKTSALPGQPYLDCQNGMFYPLVLFDPAGASTGGLAQPITGSLGATNGVLDPTQDHPLLYSLDGAPCMANTPTSPTSPTSPRCVAEVLTAFRPFCTPPEIAQNAGTCPYAEFFEFMYLIRGRVDPNTGQPAFPEMRGSLFYNRMDANLKWPD